MRLQQNNFHYIRINQARFGLGWIWIRFEQIAFEPGFEPVWIRTELIGLHQMRTSEFVWDSSGWIKSDFQSDYNWTAFSVVIK